MSLARVIRQEKEIKGFRAGNNVPENGNVTDPWVKQQNCFPALIHQQILHACELSCGYAVFFALCICRFSCALAVFLPIREGKYVICGSICNYD